MTRHASLFLLLFGVTHSAPAQRAILRGQVRRDTGHAPIGGALVRLRVAAEQTTTGDGGTFAIEWNGRVDTLLVTAVGLLPDTVVLGGDSGGTLAISLHDAPLVLSDLITSASAAEQLASGQAGDWNVSAAAIQTLPVAVEPDVNRTLAVVPGVAFSSLLSARPMLRGLGADDGSSAIDGFEAINLYHIGRFFSAVPSLAVDHADVRFLPDGVELGGTTAGEVNVVGRSGTSPGSGEVAYGAGAFSASAGASTVGGGLSVFGAGRTVKTSLLDEVLKDKNVHYGFSDFYGNVHLAPTGHQTEASIFTSSDHVAPDLTLSSPTNARMDWSNLVAGVRTELVSSPIVALDLAVAIAHHAEMSEEIPARNENVDVNDDLTTVTTAVDGRATLGHGVVLRFGGSGIHRDLQNIIHPDFDPIGVIANSQDARRLEIGSYGQLELHRGAVALNAGVRVDHADTVTIIQPRGSIRVTAPHDTWIALAAGRSARLFQIVSDSRSEPKYSYYDFWLLAGVNGTPAATMNQVSLSAARAIGHWQLRADLFDEWGAGEIDLKPTLTTADSGNLFRNGDVRVHGADLSAIAGTTDGRWSVDLSYAWAVSERNWGAGWVPWENDRRHQLRLFGLLRASSSLRLASSLELSSALPFTPIAAWYQAPIAGTGSTRILYGPEMSGRGAGWLRADLSAVKEFVGPWHSRWEAGISISNMSLGDQAARTDSLIATGSHQAAREMPLFRLPVVPSILVRGQFGTPH